MGENITNNKDACTSSVRGINKTKIYKNQTDVHT